LTTDDLKTGWLHPRRVVRNVVAAHFAGSCTTDPDVTAHAIRGAREFGWGRFLCWGHHFCKLPLADDAALEWVCGQVERTDEGAPSDTIRGHLFSMLSRAEIALAERHRERLLGLSALPPDRRQTLLARLGLAACSPAEAWRRLDDHCRMAATGRAFGDANIPAAELLLEPLERAGSESVARVMDVLSGPAPPGDGDDPGDWLTGLMITLAGRLRVEEAAPLIWDLMAVDWDWYREEGVAALTQIGTPGIVRLVHDRYPVADWSTRLYATSLLAQIRCVEASAVIIAALGCEEDDDLRAYLGTAAAAQFDDRLVPDALAVLGEYPTDPERGEIRELLVAFSHLSGFDLPERDAWEQHVDAYDDRMSRLGDPAESPLAGLFDETSDVDDEAVGGGDAWSDDEALVGGSLQRGSRVGRNEPCPCGSGKKYKRCCLLDGREEP
jgi:hypothetical protein